MNRHWGIHVYTAEYIYLRSVVDTPGECVYVIQKTCHIGNKGIM